MNIFLTTTFKRAAKKCHRNQIIKLEEAIAQLQTNPFLGDLKQGDLAGVRVHKFTLISQLVLLAYTYDEQNNELCLLSFAPHENFYQNLKIQLKH